MPLFDVRIISTEFEEGGELIHSENDVVAKDEQAARIHALLNLGAKNHEYDADYIQVKCRPFG